MTTAIQTSVSYASPKGIPGLLADMNDNELITAVCTTSVLPGTWVELSLAADAETWLANTPSGTSTYLGQGGVAVYDPMADPMQIPAVGSVSNITGSGFPVGMPITVLRRGRIFVATDAATTAGSANWAAGAAIAANVQHPSTSATYSATNTGGYFTAVAATTAGSAAGTETTAATNVYFERVAGAGLAIVRVGAIVG